MEILNPLFKTEDGYLYCNDFINSLKNIGIKKGDTILVHSDITVFGKLALRNRNELLGALVDVLKQCVGKEGTIIMPTFTYSFCNGEVFDKDKSKSTVGVLTEYFRNMPGVERTIQPIFSCAVYGKQKEEYLRIGKDSFGDKSIFQILHKNNGKLLYFGADFHACTYIHYVEQSFKVPYRYFKTFKGIIKDGNNQYEDECTFYVRDLKINPMLDVNFLKKHLMDNGYMNEEQIGYGKVLFVSAADVYTQGRKLLQNDINSFLKK
ncbi:aminoglycoside N(3)-acetyltransferase [Clostridium sp. CT7]|nr:aminoglycoside N(3)-acetyltransferase [Clostridium sp. CT7]